MRKKREMETRQGQRMEGEEGEENRLTQTRREKKETRRETGRGEMDINFFYDEADEKLFIVLNGFPYPISEYIS